MRSSSANSQYAIVRVHSNFKKDYRVVSGVKIGVGRQGDADRRRDSDHGPGSARESLGQADAAATADHWRLRADGAAWDRGK